MTLRSPHVHKLPYQQPDHVGTHGRAWRFNLKSILDAQRAKHGTAPPMELNTCAWAVYAPFSHPMWPCVAVACISLRDVPGWPSATINLPGATHEVMVMALDPDKPVCVDQQPSYLRPTNFAGQFIASSDDEARERIEQAVRDICAGTLNPDSDGRHQWAERFSRSNFKPLADMPDVLLPTAGGGVVAVGMGSANVKALVDVVEKQAAMSADESKPH